MNFGVHVSFEWFSLGAVPIRIAGHMGGDSVFSFISNLLSSFLHNGCINLHS